MRHQTQVGASAWYMPSPCARCTQRQSDHTRQVGPPGEPHATAHGVCAGRRQVSRFHGVDSTNTRATGWAAAGATSAQSWVRTPGIAARVPGKGRCITTVLWHGINSPIGVDERTRPIVPVRLALAKTGLHQWVLGVGYWVHARRKSFELHAANYSHIAAQALEQMGQLYDIKRRKYGATDDERLKARRQDVSSRSSHP